MADQTTMTVRLKRAWYGYVATYEGKELFRVYWWSPALIQAVLKTLFEKR
jgi:hypothetical protein